MGDAERIAQLEAEVAQLRAENELLREKIDLLIKMLFAASSEKLDPNQLQLLLGTDAPKKPCAADPEEDGPAADPQSTPRSRKNRTRPGLPEDIEVVEEVIDPAPVRSNPDAWRHLGEEVTERLEYEPARVRLKRTIRRSWLPKDYREAPPVIAPLPPCLLEGSLLSPSIAAHLITSKYCDHLPFYRQQQILSRRHLLELGRNTMCHWAAVCADWLEPLYKLLASDLRKKAWLSVDETPIDYLAPGHGKTKQGYLWAYQHPECGVLYDWHTGRAHQYLDHILHGDEGYFEGILLTDGYAAYQTWAGKQQGQITLAACWAHARRKFHEAAEHDPTQAGTMLKSIASLYQIESELRRSRAGPDEVHTTRQEESRPIIAAIQNQLLSLKHCLPKSTLGKARDYMLGQWSRLNVFLDHGELPIDNNQVENAIRPTKLGAKNWLFIGGAETGQRSAILYTLVENIRREGGDPYAYLSDVLERLPAMTNQDDLRPLLPKNWLAARETIADTAA